MKGSLIIVGAFLVGCLTGRTGLLPDSISEGDISLWVLYALMFQVGCLLYTSDAADEMRTV